ncbi:hypothetical protein [Nostoc sp.]
MDLHNSITVIVGLITIISAIYRLAQIEASINSKIDKLETKLLFVIDEIKDSFSEKLYETVKKLDIHLTEYGEKKIFVEYRLNGLESLIKHKFERLANWIKQIADLLYQHFGFQIKDDKF